MKLYVAVTNDRLELPLIVEDAPGKLAQKLGIKATQVYFATACKTKNKGKQSGYKILKINIEEEGEQI